MDKLDASAFATPPAWSLQTGDFGRALIVLAAVAYLVSLLSWLLAKKVPQLAAVGKWSFVAGHVALLGSFACLATLFLNNRFEYRYIWEHGDNRNPLAYRFAGIWSGQQGSFLLWASASAVFGALTARLTGKYERWFTVAYATFLAALSGILAFESPYNLNLLDGKPMVPADGFGLAPSLQNYWVTIHPPTIFMGFGSLTVLFALAFAAMVENDFDTWVPIVRPWAIISLTLTGLGLCMGGFWAYETLGWGGFWMWDPVENVSFVPWCFAIALVHGILVQSARKTWKTANLLLAGLPFILFVFGTFLTRSGFLSDASVHSFAEMDSSALKLLIAVMALATFGFGGMWAYRALTSRPAKNDDEVKGLVRENFYFYGVWAVVLMGLATLIGMSVPLVMALQGQKPKVVPESVYHQVLPYIFIPLMLLMAVTPFIGWRKTDPKALWNKLYTVLCLAVGLAGMTVFLAVITKYAVNLNMAPKVTMFGKFETNGFAWMVVLMSICYFTLIGNLWMAATMFKRSRLGVSSFLAHVGVTLLMTGLIVSRGFELKDETLMMADHPSHVLGYSLAMKGMTSDEHDRDNRLLIDVSDTATGKALFTAKPGLYMAQMGDGQENVMVWPFIQRGILHDTYISLGQPQSDASEDVSMPIGKSVRFNDQTLTYLGLDVNGNFGQAGTTFGAKVRVGNGPDAKVIEPKLQLGGPTGMTPIPAAMGKDFRLVLVSMNAADKSVTLRVDLVKPIYPVQVFHKPLTNLVFLGTFLMSVAGVMAAFYRKVPNPSTAPSGEGHDSQPAEPDMGLATT